MLTRVDTDGTGYLLTEDVRFASFIRRHDTNEASAQTVSVLINFLPVTPRSSRRCSYTLKIMRRPRCTKAQAGTSCLQVMKVGGVSSVRSQRLGCS